MFYLICQFNTSCKCSEAYLSIWVTLTMVGGGKMTKKVILSYHTKQQKLLSDLVTLYASGQDWSKSREYFALGG